MSWLYSVLLDSKEEYNVEALDWLSLDLSDEGVEET